MKASSVPTVAGLFVATRDEADVEADLAADFAVLEASGVIGEGRCAAIARSVTQLVVALHAGEIAEEFADALIERLASLEIKRALDAEKAPA